MNDNYVFFYRTSSPFSNWYPTKYTYNEIEFNCSEQGVMWNKAILFNDYENAKKILKCIETEQHKMKKLGRLVKNFDNDIWNANKINIYKNHCREKFKQNEYLKQELMNTKGKILVETSPTDKIWGIGMNEKQARQTNPKEWKGLNLLGRILTDIREEFESVIFF